MQNITNTADKSAVFYFVKITSVLCLERNWKRFIGEFSEIILFIMILCHLTNI